VNKRLLPIRNRVYIDPLKYEQAGNIKKKEKTSILLQISNPNITKSRTQQSHFASEAFNAVL
jgi:hypothetical protein